MKILSHRGIIEEKQDFPNSIVAFRNAFKQGFSIETDFRFSKERNVIISHDVNPDTELNAIELFNLVDSLISNNLNDNPIAFHIKEAKDEELINSVLELIQKFDFWDKTFLFDLFLKDLEKIKINFPKVSLGVSVGEKNYAPTIFTKEEIEPYFQFIDIIWADEWRSSLYAKDFFEYYKAHNKKVYVISPELHKTEKHPFSDNSEELWEKIKLFQFDGICTDFPKKANEFFN
jgi:glycerophosphoryl diester phosphodiesterase